MFLWRFLSKKSDIRYSIPIILTPQDISNILIIEAEEAKELISSGLIERIPYLTKDRILQIDLWNISAQVPDHQAH